MRRAVALAVLAAAGAARAHTPVSTDVTWAREVSRIVRRSCAGCHFPKGSSFPLESYAQARPWAKAIRDEVLAGSMPPWPAAAGLRAFENPRALAPRAAEIVAAWADGGAPEGDPRELAEVAPEPPFPLVLRDRDRIARAVAVDGIAIEGAGPLAIEGRGAPGWLGGAVPPGERVELARAIALPQGARVRLPKGVTAWLRPSRGQGSAARAEELAGRRAVSEPGEVLAVEPDGPAGAPVEVRLWRAGGARETLVWIPRFDPKWRFTYWLRTPLAVQPGDRLEVIPDGARARLLIAAAKTAPRASAPAP